ncbi:DnaA ATPase domain-containing protein, partial [Streptococcus pyogenes]
MSEQEIWKKVLEVAESEISKSTFNTFLKDTELKEIRDNVAIIFVIHEFYAEWLNSNYKEVIQTIMKDVIGYEVEPKFFTAEQLAELDETSRKSNTPSEPQRQIIEDGHEGTDQFNTHNTFDTFVIGPGNRFPHAASLAVAEAPAQAYNPLFIYGGVGLGKTHLMHAIGHHVLSNQPNAK